MNLTTHLQLVPRLRMQWAVISTSPYAFLAWCVLKHGDNFTSYIACNYVELQDCCVQTCTMVVQKCPEAQSWPDYLMMWFTSLKHNTLNGTQICLFLIYCTAENIPYCVGKSQWRFVSFYFWNFIPQIYTILIFIIYINGMVTIHYEIKSVGLIYQTSLQV